MTDNHQHRNFWRVLLCCLIIANYGQCHHIINSSFACILVMKLTAYTCSNLAESIMCLMINIVVDQRRHIQPTAQSKLIDQNYAKLECSGYKILKKCSSKQKMVQKLLNWTCFLYIWNSGRDSVCLAVIIKINTLIQICLFYWCEGGSPIFTKNHLPLCLIK